MRIEVKTEFAGIQRALRELPDQVGKKALASALNKAADQARTAMSREIRQEFNLTAGYVRDRLRIRRASAQGNVSFVAELIGGSRNKRSANLIAFVANKAAMVKNAARSRKGAKRYLKVRIKRGQAKELKGAFIGNQGRTVFRRVGKSRLPIEAMQTIDVGQMFNTRRISSRVLALVRQRLPVLFDREARFYLSRLER